MSEVLFGRGGHIEALRDPEGPERWEVAEMDLTSNAARWASYSEWASWNEEALNANFREWRRIQPTEAVTMTAEAAEAWLRANPSAVARDNTGEFWGFDGRYVVCARTGVGIICEQLAPYTLLIPATRPQVEMAAEIERLTKLVTEEQGISTRRFAEAIEKTNQLRETKAQLASALASQKAAEAALEAERMHGCWLRNALELCAKYFGGASVDDLRQHIAKTLRDIDETTGKESGG